jgi:hypothetical protein
MLRHPNFLAPGVTKKNATRKNPFFPTSAS